MPDGPLVIWVNSPPFVEKGAFAYLESHWPTGVRYAVLGSLRQERVAMGWNTPADDDAHHVWFRGERVIAEFADEVIRATPNAMHLVAGLSSSTGRALERVVRVVPPERVAVFSERPGAYGPLLKRTAGRFFVPLKYWWLVRRYRRRVGLLLPLGKRGVLSFARYGWPQRAMAPFMYAPVARGRPARPPHGGGRPVRFLYVGRLSRYTKGTDILMDATRRLRGDWHLTLVGGHGDLVPAVNEWARRQERVDAPGSASPEEVWSAIVQHDVVVVPSRFDGWNVVVNEALSAGRGVIATDEAVSHELVEASGAGEVVAGRSARALARAMQRVIDRPQVVETWSERAARYAGSIAPERAGEYLLRLLSYSYAGEGVPSDVSPWLQAGAHNGGGRGASCS